MPDNIADILGGKDTSIPVKKDVSKEFDEKVIFTAEEFVKHVGLMEMISSRASDPIRRLWDQAWGLYNNAYDWSDKAPWQAKNYIPRLNMSVRTATFMVKRSLLGPGKPYSIEGVGQFGKLVAYYLDKLVKQQLESAKYVTSITDSLHAAMLSHLMVLKVYPVHVTQDSVYFTDPTPKPTLNFDAPLKTKQYKRLKIRIDPVDPYHVHLDPTGQNKFIIHDITMDLYDLIDIARQDNSGYDIDEIKKIQEDFTAKANEDNSTQEARSGQDSSATDSRRSRTVFVQEYYGDVWSSDGRLVARKCLYAIANKKYLIRPPVVNKLPDPENPTPFVITPIIRKPFSVWHQGFGQVVGGLQVMMTELMNLMMDANLFSSAKAFEIDIDQVYDPLEFLQGIAPGKTFKKRGGGFATTPMIREISIGQVAQQSLAIYQALDREFQSGIGINEFTMPSARSSGSRTTATEVMEKSSSATTFMEDIANTLEEGSIEPLVSKVAHYIAEYMVEFDDPWTLEIFGQEDASRLAIWMRNPAFRRAIHTAPMTIRARGLSATMNKMRSLEKLATLSKILQPYPALLQRIDPAKILDKVIEAVGWYPQDILAEMAGPPVPVPPTMAMPQMPIGSLPAGFMENANNGMSQVPNIGG